MRVITKPRCSSIVQPGEYLISRWDGQQCSETHPHHLIKCEGCGKLFCLTMHWPIHVRSECGQ